MPARYLHHAETGGSDRGRGRPLRLPLTRRDPAGLSLLARRVPRSRSARARAAYKGLAPGVHRFAVYASDFRGRDPYPELYSATVDPGVRDLKAKVRPAHAKFKPGRRKRFRVPTPAPQAHAVIKGVSVCVKAPKTVVRKPAGCPYIGSLEPGGRLRERFVMHLRRARAHKHRTIRLKFIARAPDADHGDTASASIRRAPSAPDPARPGVHRSRFPK